MCERELQRLQRLITDTCPTAQEGYLRDYAKIYSVMLDWNLAFQCLSALDGAIPIGQNTTNAETNWLRLSSILAYYERQCWFQEDVLLPIGILKSDDFYHYIRLGYVLKDYGAGVKHGEFTHRLQWHILLRIITDGFKRPITPGWDHSPLQLYVSLGRKQNHSVWGLLFDRSGEARSKDAGLNHPDTFHAWLLGQAGAFGKLVAMAQRRETKRREEFVKHIHGYIEYLNRDRGFAICHAPEFLGSRDPLSSHESFKQFDLWFADNVLRNIFADEETAVLVYNTLSSWGAPVYQSRKTAAVDRLAARPKYRTTPYVPVAPGPVYKLTLGPLIDEKTADSRALSSRGRLVA